MSPMELKRLKYLLENESHTRAYYSFEKYGYRHVRQQAQIHFPNLVRKPSVKRPWNEWERVAVLAMIKAGFSYRETARWCKRPVGSIAGMVARAHASR